MKTISGRYVCTNIKQMLAVIATFSAVSISQAAQTCSAMFSDQPLDAVFFGSHSLKEALPHDHLRVLVWNVHKGTDPLLPLDFAHLSMTSDLVLLQESVSDKAFTREMVNANPDLGWTQAKSFQRKQGDFTGVATGSMVKVSSEEVVLSDVYEPLSNTPKTILTSLLPIEGREEKLLVANMHAINFVTNQRFRAHVDQLISKIKQHQGPLLVAGDFNTWNSARMKYLQESLEQCGLKAVTLPKAGLLSLDHIFVRGLYPEKVFDETHIKSSDHAPNLVDFYLLD